MRSCNHKIGTKGKKDSRYDMGHFYRHPPPTSGENNNQNKVKCIFLARINVYSVDCQIILWLLFTELLPLFKVVETLVLCLHLLLHISRD